VSKLVPADESTWVITTDSVPALVSSSDWDAAQAERSSKPKGGRRPDQPSRYALRGLLSCTLCGHPMQGNSIRRAEGRVAIHYRCVYRSNYPGDAAHPKSIAVAEARILPVLDEWLARLFDPDHFDESVEALLHSDQPGVVPAAVIDARKLADDARARLARHVAAIDAGVDPTLLVEQTQRAQKDLARASEVIAAHAAKASMTALTAASVRATLSRHRGLPGLLNKVATPDERRSLYADLGIDLTYERRGTHGHTRELVRPFLTLPGAKSPPWSNCACRRGDLNGYSTDDPKLILGPELWLPAA
jgi:site-specific DNA recombinase